MASPELVAALRPLINDNSQPYAFDAPTLGKYLDDADGDLRVAAGQVWAVKASSLAGLVDVTEGSSSRKMSSLYKQALEMAAFYGGSTADGSSSTPRTRTRAIIRTDSYDQ